MGLSAGHNTRNAMELKCDARQAPLAHNIHVQHVLYMYSRPCTGHSRRVSLATVILLDTTATPFYLQSLGGKE